MSRMNPREVCAKCRHWSNVGECRRDPPRLVEDAIYGKWPLVSPDDYCGEFAAMMTTGREQNLGRGD